MVVADRAVDRFGLVQRVKGLLLSPVSEWRAVATEAETRPRLLLGYICILAAIPVVARLLGAMVFGADLFGVVLRDSILAAVIGGVVNYGLTLIGVFVLASVARALAPAFEGHIDSVRALQLVAYAGTAEWVSGALYLYPPLGGLALLGSLYGVYLLYVGVPVLTQAPAAKALGFTATIAFAALIINVAVGLAGFGVGKAISAADAGLIPAAARLPDGTTVNVARLRAATTALRDAANRLKAAETAGGGASGPLAPLPPDLLKTLMPRQLSADFPQSDLSAGRQDAGGLSTSNVRGVYARGDGRITLTVTDMAAAGALTNLAGAFSKSSDVTATRYEKFGLIDGRMTSERFDRATRSGQYAVAVAGRFLVEAEGSGVDVDQLKAAVSSVGFDKLERLAKLG